ncbi:MAG: caspase family protein [Elusimicrobia bacterium]|nr:caspase family protein [Elusimicrobiota bacterium]
MSIGIALCLAPSVLAGEYDGGLPGEFIEYGAGARAMGMGGAFGALAQGPEALIWNPGGIGLPYRNSATFTHKMLFEGASMDELSYGHAFAKPFGVGISVISFDNGDLTQRDASNTPAGSFSDTRRAYLFGWGIQPAKMFAIGFTHKILTRQLADYSSSAFDSDLGVVGTRGRYRAGVQLQNVLGAKLGREGGADTLPRGVRLGGAIAVMEPLLASFDILTRAGETDYRFGMEYSLLKDFAFRSGWDGVGPTFGTSWQYRSLGVDYAITPHSVLGISHQMTLRMNWGKSANSKLIARNSWRDDLYNGIASRLAEGRDRKKRIAEYLMEAQESLDAGQYQRALAYGNMALHLDPRNTRARTIADKAILNNAGQKMVVDSRPSEVLAMSSGTAQSIPAAELKALPAYRTSRQNAFAVIIGVEHYRDIVMADYAARDAISAKEYFQSALGIPAENIVLRLDSRAGLGDFKAYLEVWLKEKVKSDSEVFVYYAGHGTPEPETGRGYLVPYDAAPETIRQLGYPLSQLYESLGKLPVKRALVVLDACFSGLGGPRTVIAQGTRPVIPTVEDPILAAGKITVFAASSGTQISGTYGKKQMGLFTYFLLRGLQGDADLNNDKLVTLSELYNYVRPHVIVEARSNQLEQEPRLLPSTDVEETWKEEPLAVLK